MSAPLSKQLLRRWPAAAGWSVLTCYLLWNVYWISRLRFPPSILYYLSGIPSPTTGGTRAISALLRGEWQLSLQLNAFAVPIACLFIATVAAVGWKYLRRRTVCLSNRWLWAWVVLLGIAWVWKLTSDPAYW